LLARLNPLESKGNYTATSNTMKLVHWPLMGGLNYIWYSKEGTGQAHSVSCCLYQMSTQFLNDDDDMMMTARNWN